MPPSLNCAEKWTDREVMYISYLGALFLRMLKALILPLIIPSLIAAVGSLDMSLSGRVRTQRRNSFCKSLQNFGDFFFLPLKTLSGTSAVQISQQKFRSTFQCISQCVLKVLPKATSGVRHE